LLGLKSLGLKCRLTVCG